LAGLLSLHLLASATERSSAQLAGDAPVVSSDGNRLTLQTRFLHLEMDLRSPAIDVLRVAPRGDAQFGQSVGSLREEGQAVGRRFQSGADDSDGARVTWTGGGVDPQARIEGIDLGPHATASWMITVFSHRPMAIIQRQINVDPSLDSHGLSVTTPSAPDGIDPSTLAYMLQEGTYRLEVGPASLERPGGMLGVLAVDNPELTFSARTDAPDRVVGRQEPGSVTLGFSRRLPFRASATNQELVTLQFGWDNDYVTARSDGMPEVERRLLASGYYGNAVLTPNLGTMLTASMRDYRGSTWSRDTDYALQGYSYVLDDLSAFRNTLQRFVDRIDKFGVAPEFIMLNGEYGNRQSWDSMANVIEAVHTYVAKTGDVEFYRRNEEPLKRALAWIRALDVNGDGLPDRDVFPYGYTDTVENGPLHTYAIAKFYAAFQSAAELDTSIGRDPRPLRAYLQTMRASFGRPLATGGYWNPETGYPIAWKRADGRVFTAFETFGVFEAIRVGLLTEPAQLASIAAWLDANRDAFLNGNPYPERLMIGGYDLAVKKAEVPLEKLWIMDCNAPWITGISVPARVALDRLEDARDMLAVYASSANRRTPHAEFGAGPQAVFGPGETQDGGRLWDNWSWFNAVYGTHFGLKMTVPALEISPAPLDPRFGRRASGLTYQQAHFEIELLEGGYKLTMDQPRRVVLKPPAGFSKVEVNGDGLIQPQRAFTTAAGASYVVIGRR
jgi:hypothetical protein